MESEQFIRLVPESELIDLKEQIRRLQALVTTLENQVFLFEHRLDALEKITNKQKKSYDI